MYVQVIALIHATSSELDLSEYYFNWRLANGKEEAFFKDIHTYNDCTVM